MKSTRYARQYGVEVRLTGIADDFLIVFFEVLHFADGHVAELFGDLALAFFDGFLHVAYDGVLRLDISHISVDLLLDPLEVLVERSKLEVGRLPDLNFFLV